MYCSNCGQYNDDSLKFCTNCGSLLGSHTSFKKDNTCNNEQLNNSTNSRLSNYTDNCSEVNDLDLFGVDNGSIINNNRNTTNKRTSNKFLIISCISFLIFLLFLFSNNNLDKKDNSSSYKNDYTKKETESAVSNVTANDKSNNLVLDNIDITPYSYITVKDLDSHSSDIVGKQVLIVDTISSVYSSDSKNIQILVPDTYHDMDCYLASDSNVDMEKLSSHNYIAVVGIVDNPTDAYFFKSPKLINCYVVAYGDDAYSLYTKYTETSTDLSSSFTSQSTETQSSGSDTSDLSESDFKLSCEVIDAASYNDILRNPDSYKKNVKFTGVVDQIIEGWFGSYTLYINDSSGNKWGITYSYKDGEAHKLEGDNITVYGLLDGTQTTETVLGKQVTLPYISADYIE